jgi:putative ABC transport system permease protein
VLRLALLRPSIRLHLSAPFRLLTILLSIALGTLLCTVILLVNTAAVQSLEHSVNDLAGETDLSVLSAGGESFTEGTFDRVLRIPGVSAAVPLIQNKAFLLKKDGGQTALTLLGIDLLNDSSVRNKENKDRRFVSDPLDFMARPDSIALTHVLADQTHLKLHDVVSVATAIGIKSFTIRALIDDAGAGKAFGGRVAVMDIEASRVAFGKSGKLDQINLKVEDRGQLKETAARVQSELGSVYSVEPPSNQLQSLRDLIAPIQIVMGFLGLAAFLMAYVLILNTARISISERRREIGILRAIGFERSQIISLLMSEYAILGAVGSGAGSLLAWFGTKQTAKLVQQVLLTQTQVSVDLSEALFNPQIPILVGLFGLVISLLAVFHPLWTASRISPSEAILLQRAEDSAPTLAALRRRSALLILGFVFLLPLIIPLPEKLFNAFE